MWTQTSTTANQGQIMRVSSKYLYTFAMGQKRDKNIHRLFTRYEMVSLSLHETNPGHHLQGSYSIEQADWPMFRKVMLLTTLMALCSFWENCGLFPCLMFSTDHGGQNIQPSALQVPNQHWLCWGETPLWNAPTVVSYQFMLKSFSGLGSVQWGPWIWYRYVRQSFGQV